MWWLLSLILRAIPSVGAVHVYGKQQHNHSKTAVINAQGAPILNLRGSDHDPDRQAASVSTNDNSIVSDHSSDHVIDALDTTEHVSPYHTKYLKLDHTYFTESDTSGIDSTIDGTQSLEINFELLSALDVPLIKCIKAAAAAAASRCDSNTNSNDDSDYSDAITQHWKFKLVRLSCC
jgi:hypothetical protein